MADSFVHVKGTDEFHDFIDIRGLKKKKDKVVHFKKKKLKSWLNCFEMLLANFLPIVQKN